MLIRTLFAALVATTLSLPAFAAEKVTLAYINATASNWPAFVARDKGFFQKEGLDVDFIQSGQSSKSAQQVMAGVANFGSSSMVDTFRAIDGGGDLIVFMNSFAQGIHSLVAQRNIKSVADLKGKRVIVGGQKDITGLWWYAMARQFGMDGTKDVQLLFSGATSNRMAALQSGGVEAAILSPPASFTALEQGFTDLGLASSYMGDFPMMIYHVNKTWAATHKEAVVAFVKAHNKAVDYMLDAKNRTEVSEIMAKASGTTLDDNLKTYDMAVAAKSFVPDGSVKGVDRVLKSLVVEGDLKTPLKPEATFYTSSYVDAAN